MDIESCAIEYIRLVNEAAALKTQMYNTKCTEIDEPMVPEDGPGTPPCWACHDDKGNRLDISEHCESCQKRHALWGQRKLVVKKRLSALAKLKRACKRRSHEADHRGVNPSHAGQGEAARSGEGQAASGRD